MVRPQMESSSWSHNAEGVLAPRMIGILSQNEWVAGACYKWEGPGELEKKDVGGFGGTPKAPHPSSVFLPQGGGSGPGSSKVLPQTP